MIISKITRKQINNFRLHEMCKCLIIKEYDKSGHSAHYNKLF